MVLLALLYGNGDFYKTGQYAMALGYDADCNAATACTVVGAADRFRGDRRSCRGSTCPTVTSTRPARSFPRNAKSPSRRS